MGEAVVFDLRLKKKKFFVLPVIFKTGFLLHFLFKWFALMITAHRFQDYAEDENKTSISWIHISEIHSLLHFVFLYRSLLCAWVCSYFQFCLILSHNFYIITHWRFYIFFISVTIIWIIKNCITIFIMYCSCDSFWTLIFFSVMCRLSSL